MSQTLAFYLARAEEAADDARTATLDNVRDRALRSETAWRGMAARLMRVEAQRDVTERAKQDRLADEG
jgi:hypothetical protein